MSHEAKAGPATQDNTSSAKPIYRGEVGVVSVSFFPNNRATLQRRYRNKEGMTAFANSLRPQDWPSARRALELLEEWYASHIASQKNG